MSAAREVRKAADAPADLWRYAPALRAYFLKRRRIHDADDLVQECLMRVQARQVTKEIENPEGYLFQVASSVLYDSLRRDRSRRSTAHCELVESLHPVEEISPLRVLEGRERLKIVLAVLNGLPERTRQAFILVRLEGKSYSITAREMGVSVSGVEKHIMKAVRALTERLRDADGNKLSAERPK